jgi:hypothetical protein
VLSQRQEGSLGAAQPLHLACGLQREALAWHSAGSLENMSPALYVTSSSPPGYSIVSLLFPQFHYTKCKLSSAFEPKKDHPEAMGKILY